ncbi:MAG: D-2-hydroxyacid dehydrogenase [Clostridia bacterium]|nr:D-2-hydroxyacid dehydrogenase [Clostridia bacterium]
MNRTIAVRISFYSERWEKMISDGIKSYGFTPRFLHDKIELKDLEDCEILFGMFQPELLAQCRNLKWLQCSFAGVDTYCQPGVFFSDDVILTNASGAYGITIAEHMLCVLLMMMRRMPEYQALTAERGWKILGDIRSIYDSRITVVGMGDIGSNFGRRAKALGAHITGVRRTVRETPDWAEAVFPIERLAEAVKDADVVTLCLPGTESTRAVLNRDILSAMKPGAYVINVGRGTAVDQQALCDALVLGKLAGAAIDVAVPEPLPKDHFLWDAPNLLITPHVSGNMSLAKTCELVIQIFLRNLSHWQNHEPMEHLVDRKRGY